MKGLLSSPAFSVQGTYVVIKTERLIDKVYN